MKTTALVLLFILAYNGITAQSPNIYDASRNGDLETLKELLQHQPDLLDQKNPSGFTPLILAVYNDQEETSEFLIQAGADVNAFDNSGNTALMGAIFKGYYHQVKLLITAKANVNQQNYNKATALTFAATFGTADMAMSLMEAGGDPTLLDNQGKTPLDHALFQGNAAVAKIFSKQ